MELTIDQALQQGVAAHKAGELQEAERLYRDILRVQPNHPDANHNLGVLSVSVGKIDEAIPLFKLALKANDRIEQFWVSYIDALIIAGQFEAAKRGLGDADKSGISPKKLNVFWQQLEEALPADAWPSQNQIDGLLEYYQTGRFDDAERLALSLTQQFPRHPLGWSGLGVVLYQSGRLSESLLPLQKATELSPQDPAAFSNLGNALQEMGRLEEAEASYRRAIALKPDYAESHSNLGNVLRALGRLDQALESHQRAVTMKPDFAAAYSNLGATLQEMGKLDESKISLEQAIALKPDFAPAYSNLGVTLRELGRLKESVARLEQAIVLKPDFADAQFNLGNTLGDLDRFDEAEACYQQAILLKHDFADAHNNLGNILRRQGRLDEAETRYSEAVALKPGLARAHRNLTTIKRYTFQDAQFSQMQLLYLDPTLSEDARCHICFALAKASDDLSNFAEAFGFYAEGNALRKKQLSYDKQQDATLFELLKHNYSRVASYSLHIARVLKNRVPIFIVGMPRSGTTLVEQIISSHRLVTGAGELSLAWQFGNQLATGQSLVTKDALLIFREQYLQGLGQRSFGKVFVTDKMPQNFRLLGLIAAAIPEAKIIHVRRDPAALCWANYTQYFPDKSLGYCYSIDDILHYHERYQDLMRYWHKALPGRIYDLDYELLTRHQEEETRRLIAYLELNWEAACLSPQDNERAVATASAAQVRQKVYQGSSERWKRYRPFLAGALERFDLLNN